MAAKHIADVFSRFGFSKKFSKCFKDIFKDFSAKLILFSLDFFEIIDSIACAMASKAAEDFILFDAPITSSGIRKKNPVLSDLLQQNI